ncbi:FAD-dependent monooxygenase [Rhizobium tumorigenes]|uniref:FAD-dependent monooxygenase n=1 Tax=Rhizobium tumorigenes TaxID=2041385 RepID=UPI00241F0E72|nr:FAD-dependent monooxygenase [Rhizobium tumorigenes]WFR99739.1 FAD-dependent monooxygenase [Rhizobium tumorigenes]
MKELQSNVERSAVLSCPTVLISGASFAGLATAYWMNKLGYHVTVVEIADGLRKGGTPVDIKEQTIDILRRMGLLDAVRARSLPPRRTELKDADGVTKALLPAQAISRGGPDEQYEVDRDVLLDIFLEAVADKVGIFFARSITRLEERQDCVVAWFSDGSSQAFSLILGCDGMRSNTRRLAFGNDEEHMYFLETYAFLKVVQKTLIEPDVTEIYTIPGRMAMLNGYEGRTDIALGFHSEQELTYDHLDKAQQIQLILDRFDGIGWRVPELLGEVDAAGDFYFDKICQIRMPSWSKGRVALVGDAGYCPSPFAGMGGSMAIIGAAAISDALQRHGDDFAAAFRDYDTNLRPFVEKIQDEAVSFGKTMLAPETEAAVDEPVAR